VVKPLNREKKLRPAGADHVEAPASISGERMLAHMITHPTAMDFNQDDGRNTLNELLVQIDVQMLSWFCQLSP